jgi:hypothetical protein
VNDHLNDEELERLAFQALTREQLAQIATRAITGRAEDGELESVEEHLFTCDCCVERAKETVDFLRAMRDAAREIRKAESGWQIQLANAQGPHQ